MSTEELIIEEIAPVEASERQQIIKKMIADLLSGEKSLSFTALKNFSDSPTDFVEYVMKVKVVTPAMEFGTLVHTLILEPALFDERYYAIDDTIKCEEISGSDWKDQGKKPRATKLYKEWMMTEKLNAGDKIVIKTVDYQKARIMANNVLYNRASKAILARCPNKETGIQWEYMNYKFRGFIDADGDKDIGDIKVMPDASKRPAMRTIADRMLYLQAVMYLSGKGYKKDDKHPNYYIIAVDRKGGVGVYKLPPLMIKIGFEKYEWLIGKFNDCMIDNRWNESYDFWGDTWEGVHIADIPSYLLS